MKPRFKLIIIIISISLLFVLSYQLYWLVNFFNDEYNKLEDIIINAAENADSKEFLNVIRLELDKTFNNVEDDSIRNIMLSANELHIQINSNADKYYDTLSLNINAYENPSISSQVDALGKFAADIIFTYLGSPDVDYDQYYVVTTDSISGGKRQRSFKLFDSIFNAEISQLNISIPYLFEFIDPENGEIISYMPENISNKKNYYEIYNNLSESKSRASANDYVFLSYNLYLKQPGLYIFKQMWLLVTISFLMIILLLVLYVYLLRIIWRQKTIDEIKSDFINNMTHELKTPISVTYAAVDTLQNFEIGTDPQKRDEYLTISKKQLLNLNSLVEQILTMSVEERKNIKLSLEKISISELFENLKYQFNLNPIKDIQFNIDIQDKDLYINADKMHFTNIMNNLIENAIKYSYDSVNIKLSAYKSNNNTVISVCDNGIGIPKDSLDKVFERFYRVSKGNIHDIKGYGLGLFYVKTIIEKHGWNIKVKSTEKKGSCFNIYIP